MSKPEPEKPFRQKILEGIEETSPFFFKMMGIASLVSGFAGSVGSPLAAAVGLIDQERYLATLEASTKAMEYGVGLIAVGYIIEIAHNTRRPR